MNAITKTVINTIIASFFGTVPALAENIEVNAPIDNVTIYSDEGALIERKAIVDLSSGSNTIVIHGLPLEIQANQSFKAIAKRQNIEVTNISFRHSFGAARNGIRFESLENTLKALRNKTFTIRDQIQVKLLRLKLLENTIIQKENNDSATTNLDESLDQIEERASKTIKEIRLLKTKLKDIEKQISVIEDELDEAQPHDSATITAFIDISANSSVQENMMFRYFVEEAFWKPNLRADLSTNTGRVKIDLIANIEQNSGEDWENVSILLSTARSNERINASEVFSEFLTLTDDNIEMMRSISEPKNFNGGYNLEEIVVTGNQHPLISSGYNKGFLIKSPTTVNSGTTMQSKVIRSFTYKAELLAKTSAEHDTKAYLYANIDYDGDTSIPPLPAIVSQDNLSYQNGFWPALVPGESVSLPFGSINDITIKKKRLKSQDENSGVFNRSNTESARFQISAQNTLAVPLELEITDRIPVAKHEDISVKTTENALMPTKAATENMPGIISWTKLLAPGENWSFEHGYLVTYPEGKYLNRIQ